MKLARFWVSAQLLREALHLPYGTLIVGALVRPDATVEFTVNHESLRELDEGESVPLIRVELTKIEARYVE